MEEGASQEVTKGYVVKWQPDEISEGSVWFRRTYKESKKISSHIRFKRIKHGFYRMYFRQAYLHEVYKEMPMLGYDWDDTDMRLAEGSQKYYEEFEDKVDLTRKIKNFKEGFYDTRDKLWTRVYLMRTNEEFYQNARNAYKTVTIH